MKRLLKGLAAAALLCLFSGMADAGWRCRGVDNCVEAVPCGYTYVTQYQEVQRTVFKCVAETKDVEITEKVWDREIKKGEKEVVYLKQVLKPMKRDVKIWEPEYKTVEKPVTVCKQVLKKGTQEYWVCEPVSHTETRKVTHHEPVYTDKLVKQPVTVWKTVTTVEPRTVTCYQHVLVSSSCSGCCVPTVCCQTVPVTTTVNVSVVKCVPETIIKEYTVKEVSYKAVTEEVKVQVVENVMKKMTRPVEYWTTEQVVETVKVQVCEMKEKIIQQEYQVCVLEQVKRMEPYEEVILKPRDVKKTVQVTTYKTIPVVVTEKVAVRVCVPVTPVCLPVCP